MKTYEFVVDLKLRGRVTVEIQALDETTARSQLTEQLDEDHGMDGWSFSG